MIRDQEIPDQIIRKITHAHASDLKIRRTRVFSYKSPKLNTSNFESKCDAYTDV